VISIDATAKAIEAGKAIAANSVLIGAISAVKGFPLSPERMLDSLLQLVPAKARDINVRAFEMGFDEVTRSAKS
jgi:indolepyruvate ferredoxin oxidoreductase beta subunit